MTDSNYRRAIDDTVTVTVTCPVCGTDEVSHTFDADNPGQQQNQYCHICTTELVLTMGTDQVRVKSLSMRPGSEIADEIEVDQSGETLTIEDEPVPTKDESVDPPAHEISFYARKPWANWEFLNDTDEVLQVDENTPKDTLGIHCPYCGDERHELTLEPEVAFGDQLAASNPDAESHDPVNRGTTDVHREAMTCSETGQTLRIRREDPTAETLHGGVDYTVGLYPE